MGVAIGVAAALVGAVLGGVSLFMLGWHAASLRFQRAVFGAWGDRHEAWLKRRRFDLLDVSSPLYREAWNRYVAILPPVVIGRYASSDFALAVPTHWDETPVGAWAFSDALRDAPTGDDA